MPELLHHAIVLYFSPPLQTALMISPRCPEVHKWIWEGKHVQPTKIKPARCHTPGNYHGTWHHSSWCLHGLAVLWQSAKADLERMSFGDLMNIWTVKMSSTIILLEEWKKRLWYLLTFKCLMNSCNGRFWTERKWWDPHTWDLWPSVNSTRLSFLHC